MKQNGTLRRIVGMSEFSIFIAFLIMFIIMCFASPYFLGVNNLMNVLVQISRIGIIAVGMSLVMISGGIDLSVGYGVGFCACVFAWFSLHTELAWPLIALLTLGVGALIGAFNGILSSYVGLVPFIVTLASMKMLSGASLLLSRGMPITFETKANNTVQVLMQFGRGRIGAVPIPVIFMFIVFILGSLFARYTQTGRGVYAIGNNERAAVLSGINTKKIKCLTYVITGVLFACVGLIIAGTMGTADQTIGIGYEMDVIAAVVIGGVAMSGGEGRVWGSLIGATIMGMFKNAFVLLGISSYLQSIVIGVVIIAAMTIDIVRGRRRQ
jgi:ribose transport system permease protein